MLDHSASEISRDRTCKWGIEWDTCAPGLLCCVASEPSYLHLATIFNQSRLVTRMMQSPSFNRGAYIPL
jgi:hypothetical protein